MNLKDFIKKNPKSDPLNIPLGYNEQGELISFNLAHNSSLISFGDNYELTNSILPYLLYKNKPKDLKVIYYDRGGLYQNLPHIISYNEGYVGKLFSSIQWAVDELERRKSSNQKEPRILVALMQAHELSTSLINEAGSIRGQLLEMLKYLSLFGARFGINLLFEKNNFLWKEDNDDLLAAFDAWVTPGGSFETSTYLTGNRYTFRDLNGKIYYKLSGEKAEILNQITANDFDCIELIPEIKTTKPHAYDEKITETKLNGPIAKKFGNINY
jgi:hypothetical protein